MLLWSLLPHHGLLGRLSSDLVLSLGGLLLGLLSCVLDALHLKESSALYWPRGCRAHCLLLYSRLSLLGLTKFSDERELLWREVQLLQLGSDAMLVSLGCDQGLLFSHRALL